MTALSDEKYQGWSNVATWSVALYMNNEWHVYDATRYAANIKELEAIIRASFPPGFTFEEPDWSKVNWQEIWEDRHADR